MAGKRIGLRVLEVSGSPRQIGSKLGKLCGTIGESMVSKTRRRLRKSGKKWEQAVAIARNYMLNALSFDPAYIEWLKGYSDSSGIPFDDLTVILMDGETSFCTDILVNQDATADGAVYSAHTEDWRAADLQHVVLIKGKPKNEPAFLAMSLGGIELDAGMNSAGLSFAGNSMSQDDTRIGIPKIFLARKLLAARTISQAIQVVTMADRASSYNINLGHKSGEIYCVEGSATEHALLYPNDGYLVHTNHYLDERMARHDTSFRSRSGITFDGGTDTIVRYHRALRLVRRDLGFITADVLKNLLSDHVDYPFSICYHDSKQVSPSERTKTIFALVMDSTRSKMHICVDNPCKGNWWDVALP